MKPESNYLQPNRPVLRGMNLPQMTDLLAQGGFQKYRAKQLHHWIYQKWASEFDEMRNLPKAVRQWLAENTSIGALELVRIDGPAGGTCKVLFRLPDDCYIESVVMRDEGEGRTSLCISSQVGCAVGCTFCLTGYGGFQRNLHPEEIVGQVLEIRRLIMAPDEPLHHLVYMGMGEPMLNVDPVIQSIRLLTDPNGFGLSKRRITVSTSGIVPGIERFGKESLGVGLAISLNATTDTTRTHLMPINEKWPIERLLGALREFPLEARRRMTIEYVLLKGINDTPEDAQRLVRLLNGLRCKVNLIMFNPCPELPFEPVALEVLDRFARVLSEAHMTVTVRWSKGREVEAACGQLAAHYFEPQKANPHG